MKIDSLTRELVERGHRALNWVVEQIDEEGNLPENGLGNVYKCVYPLKGSPAIL